MNVEKIKNFITLPAGFVWHANSIVCLADNAEMVYVPAGVFIMGAEAIFNARPIHQVFLDSYLIARFPMTNKQYVQFIDAGGYDRQEYWDPDGWKLCQESGWKKPRYWEDKPWNHPSHPVVGISWFEADAYNRWSNRELPTEAQWEKAARGGIYLDGEKNGQEKNPFPERKYSWGDVEPNDGGIWRAIYKDEPQYGSKSTAPVGLVPAGASPYGCEDMCGNVWEWCQDWFQRDYYISSPAANPKGPSEGTTKVLRGGSWCRDTKQLHVSFRTKDEPGSGGWDLSGFRCAKSI